MAQDKKNVDTFVIDGIYYDTKMIAARHPGGALPVLLVNNRDATALFVSSHRRNFPHDRYKDCQVKATSVDKTNYLPDERRVGPFQQDFTVYLEVCKRIQPIIAKTNGFAPPEYFLKCAFLIGVALALDLFTIVNGPVVWASVLMGFFFALIGLNIQHDANHGAASKHGIVNRVLGFTQDYIGGNAISWSINHNTIHHVFCNDPELDRDLQIPLLRLHFKRPWRVFYVAQQAYFVFLEAGFGLVHVLFNLHMLWVAGPCPSQRLIAPYWRTHCALSLITVARFAAMWALHGLGAVCTHYAYFYCIGGLYLAFFFLISHNFVGASKEVDATKGCFVRNQASGSSNVGGAWLAFLNGGLNFQIEHHLFPRVHHSYYAKISPVVREVLEKHKIPYVHFSNVLTNSVSLVRHLHYLGTTPSKLD